MTGYTAPIVEDEGITFQKFALNCARAFGQLVEMRDDAMDAPIPEEFKPSTYYETSVKHHREKLAQLEAMTPEQQISYGESVRRDLIVSDEQYSFRCHERIAKFSAMQAHVMAWNPPTPEHEGMKNFMLEQISSSIEFERPAMPSGPTKEPIELYWAALEYQRHGVEYCLKHQTEEIQRAAERTKWVKDLRESLRGAA